VQSDPLGLEDGPNTFGYVNSSPIFLSDPLGLNILNLRFKPGWTAGQRKEAKVKVRRLNKHCKGGKASVTKPVRSGSSASARWGRAGNSRKASEDTDHELDVQLGGCDCVSNMWTLDNSVNRSLGKQIADDIKRQGLKIGDIVKLIKIK